MVGSYRGTVVVTNHALNRMVGSYHHTVVAATTVPW
jgi:hypothetical protein